MDIRLEQAQKLLQQERYAEARTLLEKIDNPAAWEWLDFLDHYVTGIAVADMKCPVCGDAKFTEGQIKSYGGVTFITGKLRLDEGPVPARRCENCGYVMLFTGG